GESRPLGGAVDVEEPPRRPGREHLPHPARVDGLAAEKQVAERREGRRLLGRHLVEKSGGEKQRGDLLLAQEGRERARRKDGLVRQTDQAGAVEESAPDLEGGGVEGDVR